ncbi:hypothetical protein Ddc_17031 [Ditylenchus destructor]|nr:hypothetical protein Ddc_17031 [Ditylenchus destructor]
MPNNHNLAPNIWRAFIEVMTSGVFLNFLGHGITSVLQMFRNVTMLKCWMCGKRQVRYCTNCGPPSGNYERFAVCKDCCVCAIGHSRKPNRKEVRNHIGRQSGTYQSSYQASAFNFRSDNTSNGRYFNNNASNGAAGNDYHFSYSRPSRFAAANEYLSRRKDNDESFENDGFW